MKVWIDQDLCTGDGLCEEIAPDVCTLLDDGLAYVVEGDKIFVLGGNQGNEVSVKPYPRHRLLGVRRAPAPRSDLNESRTMKAASGQRKKIAAGAVAAAGAAAAQITEAIGDPSTVIEAVQTGAALDSLLPFLGGACAIIAFAAFLWSRRDTDRIEEAREDDHARGLR